LVNFENDLSGPDAQLSISSPKQTPKETSEKVSEQSSEQTVPIPEHGEPIPAPNESSSENS